MKLIGYQAVLFDLDGTLCDSWHAVSKTFHETLLHFRPNSDTSHISNIRTCNDYKKSFQILFKQEIIPEAYFEYTNKLYSDLLKVETLLFPTVEETLARIVAMGFRWGIVTSKKKVFLDQLIEVFPIFKQASVILSADDVKEGKPSPEGLLKACEILRVAPQTAMYVGDLESDILAANSCGMDFAYASYGYSETHHTFTNAKFILKKFSDLMI